MELIQNLVLNREGKKWKQRWACLKRASPKNSQATNEDNFLYDLYVFLYKSEEHAHEGKNAKLVIPLTDFCGVEARKDYDKSNNVLVLITTSQTSFLSFDNALLRDQWMRALEDQFGKVTAFNINIPDKQKKKNAESTIRIYRNFFSITNKNLKCINRWYTKDIKSFSRGEDSQFMFEICPEHKTKGLLVNIVTPNANELLGAFEEIKADQDEPVLTQRDFTGSSVLIDLEQAKRGGADGNFIRRAILRASDRLRRKHRDRTRSTPMTRKNFRSPRAATNSMSDEAKYCSLDRRKSPDLGIQINNESRDKTINLIRSTSSPSGSPIKKAFSKQISVDESAPILQPKKKSPSSSSSSQPVHIEGKVDSRNTNERTLLKPRSMTIGDIPVPKELASTSKDQTTKSEEKIPLGLEPRMKDKPDILTAEEAKKFRMTMSPTDKSEMSSKNNPRRSTDSVTNNNYNRQPTNPAHYVIAKKKGNKKTPTPPPRSPASLGLTPQTMFDFPPTEPNNDITDGKDKVNKTQDSSTKRRTYHSEGSDDAFASSEPSPLHFDYSNIDYSDEPAYGNISQIRKDSSDDSSSSQIVNAHNARRWNGASKHSSDPLCYDEWKKATGEGQAQSLQNFDALDNLDYINVKNNTIQKQDSHHGSYVNVSTSESGKPEIGGDLRNRRKHKPAPLNLGNKQTKTYKNEFEKYDDDDSNIYHPFGGLDSADGSSSASSIISRRPGGSYENMAGKSSTPSSNHNSDYLNLMSPANATKSGGSINSSKPSMDYAVLTGKMTSYSKSVSTSPIRGSARSPIEKPNKSDYTLIDGKATDALNRARDTRDKQLTGNKTPTKTLK
ncbi:probable serine/threonine-protein kinase dyrk2 [Clytia hemisphaerica]|uniref:PH domain-containing protein n=1 Tax=Clytia hemisphaerica TaxID=252671 RepID=A0A7M6DMI7_9CNID